MKPASRSSCIRYSCNGRGFCPGRFTSTNMTSPFLSIIRSGNPGLLHSIIFTTSHPSASYLFMMSRCIALSGFPLSIYVTDCKTSPPAAPCS